jgi:hypothetical protein
VITKLTPAQEATFPFYREKWIKIGLSTDRVEPSEATEAVKLLYKCGGLPPPDNIYFVNGPIEASKKLKELDIKGDILASTIYGIHEASWLSFYDFFQNECGIELDDKLAGLKAVANTCGWVNVYDKAAIVHDRPCLIKRDDQNRLHCEDGPAIAYMDGFEIYAWHGTRIPAEWIKNKSSLTATIALKWENIEQRRAACEILGWANVLADLKSKVIDEDEDPYIGTLLEVEIPEIGTEKFLKVLCGTGRTFAIPVPPDMKTALDANCWTYGFDKGELRDLEFRT